MEEPLKELHEARRHTAVGALTEAERLVRAALALADAAPPESWSRIVHGYIVVAEFAITKGNSRLATSALDRALKVLDDTPEKEK